MEQKSLNKFIGIKEEDPTSNEELNEDNIDWTFKDANMKENVHGFHVYPARMVPQAVNKLIKIFGKKSEELIGNRDWGIYDPFCGSGTVLAEGRRQRFDVVGTDINPLAILISKSKSTPLDLKLLKSSWDELRSSYNKKWSKHEYNDIPDPVIPNVDFWFKENVIKKLKVIKKSIYELEERNCPEDIINFFKVAFSYTVRKSSNNRQGEFKLYRLSKKNLDKWDPDVFDIFHKKVDSNIKGAIEFTKHTSKKNKSVVENQNSKSFTPPFPIGLVVTSPPYGDHKTTVAYGQFSRYPAYWLDFEKEIVSKIDNNGLGGVEEKYSPDIDLKQFGSVTFEKTLQNIITGDAEANKKKLEREIEKAKDENREPKLNVKSNPRIHSVYTFFADYFEVIKNLYSIMLEGGYCCFVTGNRTVREYRILTHQITKEFCEEIGFKHYKTLERSIPTKTMPWENSPSNVSGDKVETMATEHIIIVFKDKKN